MKKISLKSYSDHMYKVYSEVEVDEYEVLEKAYGTPYAIQLPNGRSYSHQAEVTGSTVTVSNVQSTWRSYPEDNAELRRVLDQWRAGKFGFLADFVEEAVKEWSESQYGDRTVGELEHEESEEEFPLFECILVFRK